MCSWLWLVVLLVGCIVQVNALCVAGLAICAVAFAMSVASLPAELDASRKAMAFLEGYGPGGEPLLDGRDAKSARSVLKASALAYLSAVPLGAIRPLRNLAAYLTSG